MTIRSTALPKNIYSDTDIILSAGPGNTTVFDPAVWDDIQFSISGARVPASNAPTWAAFTANTNLYTFDVNDYVDLEVEELPHSYKLGTDLSVHVHFYSNGVDVTDRTVKFEIIYTSALVNGVAVEASISLDIVIPANTPDKTHLVDTIDTIIGTTFGIGTALGLRFKRIVEGSGIAPTNPPFLSMVGMHFEKDTLGSRQLFVK